MQLIDFQSSSIWKQTFNDLRRDLELIRIIGAGVSLFKILLLINGC